MNQRISFCYYITVVLFLTLAAGVSEVNGSPIHIDPSNNTGPYSGTFADPYNSWTQVTFNAADDYFQKCGTIYYGTIFVTASGTAVDPILIGSYYNSGGLPSYEHDNPNFGRYCGNSLDKPIINGNGVNTQVVLDNHAGANTDGYIEVNSLYLTNGGQGVNIMSNFNTVRYCYIRDSQRGIRAGMRSTEDADSTLIEYNYFDLDETVALGTTDDVIDFGSLADNSTIQYNRITGWDHGGISLNGTDNCIIQYNHLFGDGLQSYCLSPTLAGSSNTANNNIWRYNYCQDAGMAFEVHGGDNNIVYGNVFTCDGARSPGSNQGCIIMKSSTNAEASATGNTFYNNVVYNHDNTGNGIGISMGTIASDNGEVHSNTIVNNLIYSVDGNCLKTRDNSTPRKVNEGGNQSYFKNNACYGFPQNQFAWIEGSTYTTADAFNNETRSDIAADASTEQVLGHIGTYNGDPLVKNASNHEFWPTNLSPLIGAGQNLPAPYNELLDPDNTDFTASPPIVNTVTQAGYIGAYALEGTSPVNLAPIVDAGTDQSITLPVDTVDLDGTVTDDGLPNPPAAVTTTWSQQNGPGTVTFSNANAVDTTADFSTAGTYVLRLTADDSDLQTSDDITITVIEDTTPPAKPTGLIIEQ